MDLNQSSIAKQTLTALLTLAMVGCGKPMTTKNISADKLVAGTKNVLPVAPAPEVKTTVPFTVLNYRQCSPVNIPAMYNARHPASAAKNPVLRIYSTSTNSRPQYSVPANIQRVMLFEKILTKNSLGKWELINEPAFTSRVNCRGGRSNES